MATITPTFLPVLDDGSYILVQWANMANGDVGAPFGFAQWADRSVQVTGTLGTGGNARWEGSNDSTTYAVLTDPQGTALDFAALKIETVTEITTIARPRVTAGDGTTSLTVTLLARRANPMRT